MEVEDSPIKSTFNSKLSTVQLCIQVFQVCVSLTVTIFGLVVVGAGLWAMEGQKDYIIISDGDPELNRVPISMMAAGTVVALLGVIGVVGGLFTKTISGRILLGIYAFVLTLLIINEVGAGVSAVYFRNNVRNIFVQSAQRSLLNYDAPKDNTTQQWDKFQIEHQCCGAYNYTSYRPVFKNNTVPASCCLESVSSQDCEKTRQNVTSDHPESINSVGCPDKVIDDLKDYNLVVAVIVIVIGVAQLGGVVLACLMAYVSSKAEGRTSYSYNRLLQEQT